MGITIALLFWILCIALGICLTIAPLMIWKWCHSTSDQVVNVRSELRALEQLLREQTQVQRQLQAEFHAIRTILSGETAATPDPNPDDTPQD